MLKETTFLTQAESQFLHGEFKHLVAKLTSEMQTRDDKKQKWRYLKKQWNDELNQMMGIDPTWGVKAGQLFSFDLDARRKLILLNYTPAAHNVLHEVGNGAGWTAALRLMRGLVYAYERPGDVKCVALCTLMNVLVTSMGFAWCPEASGSFSISMKFQIPNGRPCLTKPAISRW